MASSCKILLAVAALAVLALSGAAAERYGGYKPYEEEDYYKKDSYKYEKKEEDKHYKPEPYYPKYGESKDKTYYFDLSINNTVPIIPPFTLGQPVLFGLSLFKGPVSPGNLFANVVGSGLNLAQNFLQVEAVVLFNVEFLAGKFQGSRLVTAGRYFLDVTQPPGNAEFIVLGGTGVLTGASGHVTVSGNTGNGTPTRAQYKIVVPAGKDDHY